VGILGDNQEALDERCHNICAALMTASCPTCSLYPWERQKKKATRFDVNRRM